MRACVCEDTKVYVMEYTWEKKKKRTIGKLDCLCKAFYSCVCVCLEAALHFGIY